MNGVVVSCRKPVRRVRSVLTWPYQALLWAERTGCQKFQFDLSFKVDGRLEIPCACSELNMPGAQKQILPGFEVPENSACETHGFGMNPPGARQAPKNGSMLRFIPFAEAFEQGVAGPMNFDKRALQEVSCYWGHMLG